MSPKLNKQDRLSNLRDRLSKIKFSGSAGFFTAKEGMNTVRILPGVGSMDAFFVQVGVHVLDESGKKREYCPSEITDGEEECPICEAVNTLYKAGDVASKGMAKQLRKQRSFWMNIIDRSNESTGPLIFTPGVKIFGQVANLINDPDYGDIVDPDNGFDLVIERKGTGMDTEYDVRARRNPSVLGDDENVENWMNNAKDLTPISVSEDPNEDKGLTEGATLWYKPYSRLQDEFNLEFEEVQEEEEDEEIARPPARKPVKPPVHKAAKEVVEEEDEPPVRKARPSSRR